MLTIDEACESFSSLISGESEPCLLDLSRFKYFNQQLSEYNEKDFFNRRFWFEFNVWYCLCRQHEYEHGNEYDA